jgi:DNA replication and repair protein RecF
VDEVLLKRTSDLYGHLRAVFFSPEDLAFFTGGPATRRRILDLGMCQQEPQMVRVLLEYRKTLKQRNTLLRTGTDSPQTRHLVHAWDHELARLGAWVTFARGRYALDLLEKAQNYYQTLSNRTEHLQGAYRTTCLKKSFISMNDLPTRSEMETLYLSVLEQTFTRDLAQRLTLTGPHRDDLVLAIGEASAERYASQGQRRSIVLSLKLAERDLLSTPLSGEDTPGPCNPSNENLALSRCQSPILLVDDVTHEMDRERCRLFLELITTSGQVFLTFTEPEAHRGLIQEATIWEVEGGKVSRG